MMSFWECVSSWSASNHCATRAFGPLEFPDRLQRPTFRHSTHVFTGNSWLFTASAFLRSGLCGTSCMTPNWVATTGPARLPCPLGGGGGWEKRWEKRRTTVRRKCFSCISDFLQGWLGSARALASTKWLWSKICGQHERLIQAGRSSLGKLIGKSQMCFRFFSKEAPRGCEPIWVHTVFVNNMQQDLYCKHDCVMSWISLDLWMCNL